MERVNYAQIIQQVLTSHCINHAEDDSELQLIFDEKRHHYQLIHLGWDDLKRVYGCIIHIDIKDEKIWIQRDRTEIGVANELLELGIPKEDIVLAFHAPYKRKYTGFAVE
jgi:hypothetical protein